MSERNVADFLRRAAVTYAIEEVSDVDKLADALDDAAAEIGDQALEYWQREAGQMLNSTRERYQQSLYVYEEFGEGVVVGQREDDQLVLDIENGKPAFDLKPGFLAGGTRRVIPVGSPRDMRTLTTGTNNEKWIHPGFRGLHLAEATDKYIDEVLVPAALERILKNL